MTVTISLCTDCATNDNRMQRPTRSKSNISISEFKSATDLEVEIFPTNRSVLIESPRNFQRSPLIDKNLELINRNTILHCTQSSPSLTTPTQDNDKQKQPAAKNKSTKKGRKKNPVLDEISMDFCQDSMGISERASPSNEAGPSSETENCKGARPKTQPNTRGKRKLDDVRKSFDSIENIPANQLPKSVNKQNDLLESMQVMINRTVVEAVEASSTSVREEINSLKANLNLQMKTLSKKVTRHHVETNLNVKGELDKISIKLTGLEHLKAQLESSNRAINNKIEHIEAIQSQAQTDTDEGISTLEITEDTHFKSLNQKFNELENRIQRRRRKYKDLG